MKAIARYSKKSSTWTIIDFLGMVSGWNIPYHSLMYPSSDDNSIFTNHINTDGMAVHFQFARAKRKPCIQLDLEDFSSQEVDEYFHVCAIDPGWRHIFTAAYGCDEQEHEIRRVSRSEYSNMIGAKQRTKRLQKRKK